MTKFSGLVLCAVSVGLAVCAADAKAEGGDSRPISVLGYLNHDDAVIDLTQPIFVPKGPDKKLDFGSGDWKCTMELKEADEANDRRIQPRQIPVSTYSSRVDKGEQKTRDFVWVWGSRQSGLYYRESTPTIILLVRDKTIRTITCVGPSKEEKPTIDDLENSVKPFDLHVPKQRSGGTLGEPALSDDSQPDDA